MAAQAGLPPDAVVVSESTPLMGELLHVTSLTILGMLLKLEEELDIVLPDNLLVGRTFHTVGDIVSVVLSAVGRPL